MLVIKFRTSHILGKSSVTDLVPQPQFWQILFCMTLTQNQDWETEPGAWCILDSTNKIHFSTTKKIPEIYYCVYDILSTLFFKASPRVLHFLLTIFESDSTLQTMLCFSSAATQPLGYSQCDSRHVVPSCSFGERRCRYTHHLGIYAGLYKYVCI